MPQGKVVWFSPKKGYGFIRPDGMPTDDNSGDMFVHYTDIRSEGFRSLNCGDVVSYDVITPSNKAKLQANNVRVINRAQGSHKNN